MKNITLKKATIVLIVFILILVLGVHIHQKTHFNRRVSINDIPVGGLTAKQAFNKLRRTDRRTKIYVNDKLVFAENDSNSGFRSNDKKSIDKALRKQYTFFPSTKRINLLVEPSGLDKTLIPTIENSVSRRIEILNKNRKAPKDAYAVYTNDHVQIIPAVKGTQYSEKEAFQQLNKEYVNGTVYIKLKNKIPLSARSKTVRSEKAKLSELCNKKIIYKVQNREYSFNSRNIITRAVYKHSHYYYSTSSVNNKIDKINHRQSTLNKPFQFKTSDGKIITTNSQGTYGWKISKQRAGRSLANAVIKNKKEINARNDIYGKGYSHLGTGYSITSNHGIGSTYVAVSLNKQHAWFYRNVKCVLSTDIVSGSDNKANRTPKGVWYIMYQQSPSVLRGTNDDGSKYSSPVQYWSPFTLSGCGFHDASWRHDWSRTAYKKTNGGSHGCIKIGRASCRERV